MLGMTGALRGQEDRRGAGVAAVEHTSPLVSGATSEGSGQPCPQFGPLLRVGTIGKVLVVQAEALYEFVVELWYRCPPRTNDSSAVS